MTGTEGPRIDAVVPREPFGTLPDGLPATRYTIGSPDGLLMRVLDLGAVIQELWVPDATGRRANVVLGCADVGGYLKTPSDYYGAVVGRVANRVAGAEVDLDGTTYQLPANDGPHTLHGGPDGFHRRLWDVAHLDERSIVLVLVSPDGDGGLPGEVAVRVSYEVSAEEVRIGYVATTDAPTFVNLTHHAHFNLAGGGSGSVDGHLLSVAADRYTPVGADLLPTGELADVSGTPLDLRQARRIGDGVRSGHVQVRRGNGYDHNLVLSAPPGEPAAVLLDPASGRRLELSTDQPGLQVYTCNVMDGTQIGSSGRAYRQGDGVALETQHFPDAPHHEGEPGWPSVVLRPGQELRSTTTWRFRSGSAQRSGA